MNLANKPMHNWIFVTYNNIMKDIMFTMQAYHHGPSTRFPFYVGLKPLWVWIGVLPTFQMHFAIYDEIRKSKYMTNKSNLF